MTNTEIIYKAAITHGIPQEQLDACLQRGDLPYHTAADWSKRGYQVQKDAAPLFDCYLWKHTNKPSAATIKAAEDAGKEAPKQSPHFYQKLSYIYGPAQVERTPAAPDLATLKARLDALPGLIYKVKGEKTGSPNVWLSGDVEAHAETIKSLGGIWSKKKSAYWIKPGTAPAEDKPAAPVPSIMEDAPSFPAPMQARPAFALPPVRLALPAPARLLALPAPKADPEPAPAPVPGPWKKCSFYTIRKEKGDTKPTAHKADGYTDGVYNYYASGEKAKQWHAIHPVYGLSVAYANTRQATQARALELTDKIRDMEAKKDARLIAYADAIRAAQDGGNLSLF
jgi:hypothetical protein